MPGGRCLVSDGVVGGLEQRIALAREIVTIGSSSQLPESELQGPGWLAVDLPEAGDRRAADDTFPRHRAVAERLGQRLARRDVELWAASRQPNTACAVPPPTTRPCAPSPSPTAPGASSNSSSLRSCTDGPVDDAGIRSEGHGTMGRPQSQLNAPGAAEEGSPVHETVVLRRRATP